jgi:hypothetical protein
MKRLLILLLLFGPAGLYAQNTETRAIGQEDEWHMILEPYFMLGNMNGNVGVGTHPVAHVDESPSDILSNLSFGFMGFVEAYSDKWAMSLDFSYLKMDADIMQTGEVESGHITLKELTFEAAMLKRVKPWLSVGLAFQLNSSVVDLGLTTTTGPESGNLTKAWVDPSIVAQSKLPVSGKLNLRFRGNIGGFGIGSKIYWQMQGYADYRFSRLFQMSLGYRAMKIDYEKGTGDTYYLYNVLTFGPVIRFGFNL